MEYQVCGLAVVPRKVVETYYPGVRSREVARVVVAAVAPLVDRGVVLVASQDLVQAPSASVEALTEGRKRD